MDLTAFYIWLDDAAPYLLGQAFFIACGVLLIALVLWALASLWTCGVTIAALLLWVLSALLAKRRHAGNEIIHRSAGFRSHPLRNSQRALTRSPRA